jgi:hypothetical protein
MSKNNLTYNIRSAEVDKWCSGIAHCISSTLTGTHTSHTAMLTQMLEEGFYDEIDQALPHSLPWAKCRVSFLQSAQSCRLTL